MKKHSVCPVEKAGGLDNFFRKIIQHPQWVLKDHIKEGMTVMDLGCGPGYFIPAMAKKVGKTGKVIAVDLQQGMLDMVKRKIAGKDYEKRVVLHKCSSSKRGISEKVDFVLAFFVVHEIPSPKKMFAELKKVLKKDGTVLLAEPKWHVPKEEFEELVKDAVSIGFKVKKRVKIFGSWVVVLGR